MSSRETIPIWYFIGVLLLVYGVIILGAGIYQVYHPPDTVLNHLQPALWWGALTAVIGGVYVFLYWPGRKSKP